jgi:hypothetical protein
VFFTNKLGIIKKDKNIEKIAMLLKEFISKVHYSFVINKRFSQTILNYF